MTDDTDDIIHQVFQFRTPDMIDYVALLLKDHRCEKVNMKYVRCMCTPQIFRSHREWETHCAAVILQRIEDTYHAWRERNAVED